MLASFRRLTRSRFGLVVVFIMLGLFALAFGASDILSTNAQGLGTFGGGDAVVRVGKAEITAPAFTSQIETEVATFRQQQPGLTTAQFVEGGGFEGTLQRVINSLALDQFGRDQGMLISKRAIDGQIASIPGLQGPNGQFDPNLFRRLLAERKLTEAGVRGDLQRDMMAQLLTAPLLQVRDVPQQLALPYANMSLERRAGQIAFVPSQAMPAGPAPTDAELRQFYQRNLARYTVPERRVLRIARVTPEQVKAQATPTEAEIAAAYNADRAKYAATEKRDVTQVVVLDQASATALAAKVKGGASLAAAASAAGLSASTKAGLTKAQLAAQTSPALADAAFAAAKGAVIGPVRGGIGFTVARVDAVEQVAGRSLAQVRGEIADALTKSKTANALSDLSGKIDDALGGSSTFDEVVADNKLSAQTTPALLASGIDPERPVPPNPALAPLLSAGFQMADGDDPQLVPTGPDGSFAVVALGRVLPAAPRPLGHAREQVTRDLLADRARLAARRVAGQILAKVNGGASLAQAWTQAGVSAPPPHPLVAAREDIDRAEGPTRAPLALMFAMAPGTTKLLEAPGGAGWAVIRLERIQPGDASRDQPRVAAVRQALGGLVGREYAEQFARATQKAVGVKTNKDAVARVRAQLLGQGGAAGQ